MKEKMALASEYKLDPSFSGHRRQSVFDACDSLLTGVPGIDDKAGKEFRAIHRKGGQYLETGYKRPLGSDEWKYYRDSFAALTKQFLGEWKLQHSSFEERVKQLQLIKKGKHVATRGSDWVARVDLAKSVGLAKVPKQGESAFARLYGIFDPVLEDEDSKDTLAILKQARRR